MKINTLRHLNERRIYKKEEYEEYADFIALPRLLRKKEFGFWSDADFAHKYDISAWTLVEWKKKDFFWRDVRKRLKIWGRSRTPDVLLSLYKNAVQYGNASEASLWFKIFEGFSEKVDINISSRKAVESIQQDIRKLIESESKSDGKRR